MYLAKHGDVSGVRTLFRDLVCFSGATQCLDSEKKNLYGIGGPRFLPDLPVL